MNILFRLHRISLLCLSVWGFAPNQALAAPVAPVPLSCNGKDSPVVWIAPAVPVAGKPVRFMVANTEEPVLALTLTDASGLARTLPAARLGGPPWGLSAYVPTLAAGSYTMTIAQASGTLHCSQHLKMAESNQMEPPEARPPASSWDTRHEAFFALWIEQLFDAPADQNLSFASLEPVLRDDRRNFLHHYLSKGEDQNLPATPDCADLPYYLRAYFAWKIGLPFSYSACNRGTAKSAPGCKAATVSTLFVNHKANPGEFKSLLRPLLDTVHSGSARTSLLAEASDFYPVPLKRESLWPGTVYADPYGHVLMIAKWLPQTPEQAGILFAVDAQPDNSVARKRYWEGNFLYTPDIPSAGPGFKSFRPLGADNRPLSNAQLASSAAHAPYSTEQAEFDTLAFHARMNQIINPQGLEPATARESLLAALIEQLQTRVVSVDNGTRYTRTHPHEIIPMPQGAAIFETIGTWEDYSTPSRDLRLLIALEVLAKLPEHIVLYPELYRLKGIQPELIKEELEKQLDMDFQQKQISYVRSDGSRWPLSLADIYTRKTRLEMAYNPNDCPEIRWGASKGTDEYQTCVKQAPTEQKTRMESYRHWFHEGKRPSR